MRISTWLLLSAGFSLATPCASAQLGVSPGITLPYARAFLDVVDDTGAHVQFMYAGVMTDPGVPNFIVVVPSTGTTPGAVQIGLNPSVVAQLQPGGVYNLGVEITTVGQNPASTTFGMVTLNVPQEPAPTIQSVVNAASLQTSLSPGASVSVLGSYLTGPTQSTTYDDTGFYPTSVAGTSVTFNGTAAPLVYVSPSQINAIVPFALAGQTSGQVVVQRFQQVSNTFTLPLQAASPGIFTATQNGNGQAAILQYKSDGAFSYNSTGNPAPAGTALEIFATGAGVYTPPAQSDIYLSPQGFTTQPVSLTIGGQPAKVIYAGTQGTQASWSIFQVNAIVPPGLASGAQPLILKIGANDNSPQATVWVQ